MEKSYNKIITVSFVIAAVLCGYVASVLIKVLSAWGTFARISHNQIVAHGVPVAIGVAFFLYMVLTPKVKNWAGEVALEISKIVWPSVKDTRALTIVVCIIVLIAAMIFWVFDIVSSQLIEFILDLQF
ncbi:preprotein translocase subunit SecE [bacterium]|nr:preprotein translocase subunit SecE [bacterium]